MLVLSNAGVTKPLGVWVCVFVCVCVGVCVVWCVLVLLVWSPAFGSAHFVDSCASFVVFGRAASHWRSSARSRVTGLSLGVVLVVI